MSDTFELVKYEAMILAIEACYSVDEVKDIRDKAVAIQAYAKQALNREAERHAAEIRVRAERKTGELLKVTKQSGERAVSAGNLKRGPNSPETTSGIITLAQLKITNDQSSQWQKLAEVPKEKFEEALADTNIVPSAAGILEAARPVVHHPLVKYDRDALMAHGHIMDFRDIMLKPAPELYSLMKQYQRDELAALIPQVIAWLQEMK